MSKIGHNGGPTFHSDAGFVAVFRAMRTHPLVGFHLFARPCDKSKGAVQPALAFIDLIMECRYEDGSVSNGGRRMEIKRGQLVGAVSWLASRWNWSPMAVRLWLDKLEADGMISRAVPGASENNKHAGKVATVITLCNYDNYQSATAHEQLTEQQTNSKQATNEQQQSKDNKETNKQYLEVEQARPALQEQPKPGEDALPHGVFVNCQTVRHKSFSISIEAIAMQLATASGLGLTVEEARAHAKQSAVAHALQWALEIENGKLSGDVVPRQIANFIRGSVASQLTKTKHPSRTSAAVSAETAEQKKRRLMDEAAAELRGRK